MHYQERLTSFFASNQPNPLQNQFNQEHFRVSSMEFYHEMA